MGLGLLLSEGSLLSRFISGHNFLTFLLDVVTFGSFPVVVLD